MPGKTGKREGAVGVIMVAHCVACADVLEPRDWNPVNTECGGGGGGGVGFSSSYPA